jgi:hypothetical protein
MREGNTAADLPGAVMRAAAIPGSSRRLSMESGYRL